MRGDQVLGETGRVLKCELAGRAGRDELCSAECPLWTGVCALSEISLDDAELDEWRDDEPIAPLLGRPPR